jgi:hypothetical protein
LSGPYGCNTGAAMPMPNAPVQQNGRTMPTPVPRITPPSNNAANELGAAARTVQEILGTIPNPNNAIPCDVCSPNVSGPSPSVSSPRPDPSPRTDLAAREPEPTPRPDIAAREPEPTPNKVGSNDSSGDNIGDLTEDEERVCQQAFKEYFSENAEKIRKLKSLVASLRSFKKLKEWLREELKDFVDDQIAEALKKSIEEDVGKNMTHQIEDARRFNAKLRDCDRAALKTFDQGIDEALNGLSEADER